MAVASVVSGGARSLGNFGPEEWLAAIYLAAVGGALAFLLWIYALQLASPTQVANTMTVNPFVAAALAAVILSEPVGVEILVGLAAVLAGLWIATTGAGSASEFAQDDGE